MEVPRIIPLPRDWRLMPGSFELPQCVCIGHRGEGAQGVAKYLAGRPQRRTDAFCVLYAHISFSSILYHLHYRQEPRLSYCKTADLDRLISDEAV